MKEVEEKLANLGDDLAKKGNTNDSDKVKKKNSTTDAIGAKEVKGLVDARIDELKIAKVKCRPFLFLR